MTNTQRRYGQDDIAIWPDGCWAELRDVWNGDYAWKSGDYEIVRIEDEVRLKTLGLAPDLGIP